jgi:hypothetical protein
MSVPTVARNVLCIDFDGTLFPWEPLDGRSPPLPGAVRAVIAFKNAGYRIVIFTSRLSKTWWAAEVPYSKGLPLPEFASKVIEFGAAQRALVVDRLVRHGIPYDEITAEKIPAEYYIDDRAIAFDGDWAAVRGKVLG